MQEIQLLTGSMQQLKVVQIKLNESKESLAELKPENIGTNAPFFELRSG